MEVIISNIGEGFRRTSLIPRSDYEPLNGQQETLSWTKGRIAVVVLCLLNIIFGILILYWGYVTLSAVLILMIPVNCCLYGHLKGLDWSRYCGCLRKICCCCRTVDLPITAELPNPRPPFSNSHNIQLAVPDTPSVQRRLIPAAPTKRIHFPETTIIQLEFLEPATGQRSFSLEQNVRQAFPGQTAVEVPAPEHPISGPFKTGESAPQPLDTEEPTKRPLKTDASAPTPIEKGEPASTPLEPQEPASAPLEQGEPASAPLEQGEPASAPIEPGEPASAPIEPEDPAPLETEDPAQGPLIAEKAVPVSPTAIEPVSRPLNNEKVVLESLEMEPALEPLERKEPALEQLEMTEPR